MLLIQIAEISKKPKFHFFYNKISCLSLQLGINFVVTKAKNHKR